MIGSVLKGFRPLCNNLNSFANKTSIRHGSDTYIYRGNMKKGMIPKHSIIRTQFFGAFMWWWVLYHLWHEGGHMFTGDGLTPDPSVWTDEELGIPPDDED